MLVQEPEDFLSDCVVDARLYGPWGHFDDDEILDLVGERPMWGTFTEPWEPEDIGNPNFVCFVVSVMEHDQGSPERYRGLVQGVRPPPAWPRRFSISGWRG